MRHPPRKPLVLPTIKTLDQRNLPRRLRILEKPFMPLPRLDNKRLPPPIRIHQRRAHEIGIRDRGGRGDGEGVLVDCLDGTPDVDDLEAVLEELGGEMGEVVGYAVAGGGVRLVAFFVREEG